MDEVIIISYEQSADMISGATTPYVMLEIPHNGEMEDFRCHYDFSNDPPQMTQREAVSIAKYLQKERNIPILVFAKNGALKTVHDAMPEVG